MYERQNTKLILQIRGGGGGGGGGRHPRFKLFGGSGGRRRHCVLGSD